MEQAQALCAVLVKSARQVNEAMPRMRDFKDIHHYTVEINSLENEGDRLHREALASLFQGGIDPMVVIRWKDIYRAARERDRRDRVGRAHPREHRDQEQLVVKALVTGASGFLGGALCAELLRRGHEVVSLVRRPGSEPDGHDRGRGQPRRRRARWTPRSPSSAPTG